MSEQPGTEEPFDNESIEEEAALATVEPADEDAQGNAVPESEKPHYEQASADNIDQPADSEPPPVFVAAGEEPPPSSELLSPTQSMAPAPLADDSYDDLPSAQSVLAQKRDDIPEEEGEHKNRNLLTYTGPIALVIALIALAGVLGVFPIKLAPKTVGTSQVKQGSLHGSDFAPGQIPHGPAGPQGVAGPQGIAGPAGQAGASGGLSNVVTVTATSPTGTTVESASASCTGQNKLVGGGASITGSGGVITTSAPHGNIWTATVTPVAKDKTPFGITASALCAVVTKATPTPTTTTKTSSPSTTPVAPPTTTTTK